MLRFIQIENVNMIEQLRVDYLRMLVAPIDGMWENTAIAHATFWEIQDRERPVGHFCVDVHNYLLRFHLLDDDQTRAQEIFRWIISTCSIQYAIASTIEPLYFSLCLDIQKSITPQHYLFHDHRCVELLAGPSNSTFRKAEKSELDAIARFYHENTEGPGEWIEAFLTSRLNREELFVVYDGETLVATGECIPSQRQTPYADLGMVVARSSRGKGLGSSMLIQLKQHCYAMGWQPICSCATDNPASKRAIEKAGFISEHRMVKLCF